MVPLILWDTLDLPFAPWDPMDVPLDQKQIKTWNVAWGMQSFANFTRVLLSRKSFHLGTGMYPLLSFPLEFLSHSV